MIRTRNPRFDRTRVFYALHTIPAISFGWPGNLPEVLPNFAATGRKYSAARPGVSIADYDQGGDVVPGATFKCGINENLGQLLRVVMPGHQCRNLIVLEAIC